VLLSHIPFDGNKFSFCRDTNIDFFWSGACNNFVSKMGLAIKFKINQIKRFLGSHNKGRALAISVGKITKKQAPPQIHQR
jgi:hypothetical protein